MAKSTAWLEIGQLPDPMLIHQAGIIVDANKAVLDLLGYARDELVGQPGRTLIHPDDLPIVVQRVNSVEKGNQTTTPLEHRLIHKDGHIILVEAASLPVTSEDKAATLTVFKEISKLQKAHRHLIESEADYRHLFLGSPLPTIVYDFNSLEILAANRAATAKFGYTLEEWRQRSLLDLFPPEELDRFRSFLPTRQIEADSLDRWTMKRKDGARLPVETVGTTLNRGSRVRRAVIIRDLTQQLKDEQELRLARKLESVGLLASGIAHDFNNILMIVAGNAQLVLRGSDPQKAKGWAETIKAAADRGKELVSHLTAFAGGQTTRNASVDLNQLVSAAATLLRSVITGPIQIDVILEPKPLPCLADESQFGQVVMNLVLNARDAMPKGGRILLKTCLLESSPKFGGKPAACLIVQDNGIGIDPAHLDRIYEPFFTTKPKDKGTGLGLSVVYGIVKRSGGDISVASSPGQGPSFSISLPLTQSASVAKSELRPSDTRKDLSILVCDDEEPVKDVICDMLSDAGFAATGVTQSQEALQLLKNSDSFSLLLTDMVMPDLSGRQLAEAARAVAPQLKVLFMSGYINERTPERDGKLLNEIFIQKPFATEALVAKVKQALSRPAEPRNN